MAALTLNSNLAALTAQRRLGDSTSALGRSFARLSSGLRINRAADDAAGLAIAAGLNVDRRVLQQGVRNVNDGVAYLSVAEGAAAELGGILLRLAELAGQSANGVYGDDQRSALEAELGALAAEYDRILAVTSFNGRSVFAASEATLTVQAGYGERGMISVTLGGGGSGGSVGVAAGAALVSVDSAGAQGNSNSSFLETPSISSDGRYVAFDSNATNLVTADTNFSDDIFVHDRQTGQTTRVSVNSAGTQGNNRSRGPSVSSDGRYVAFKSSASNLVAGDTNFSDDIFVHDRQTGQTTRVSVDGAGTQGNGNSLNPSVSGDGRYVAFESFATNLVAGDTNGQRDIFVHDRQTGQTTRVSVDGAGTQGNGNSLNPSVSGDGRYVSFESLASNLVAGDTNGQRDIFVHDRQTGQTTRVSVDGAGTQGNGNSFNPSVSSDGRYVSFSSSASNLVAGDTNFSDDIFVHDRQTGQTTRVSVNSAGTQANSGSSGPSVSSDGRYVAFLSLASNLVAGDTNGTFDIFVHDRQTAQTTRVSVDSAGTEGNNHSFTPSISGDGRHVAFVSDASNLVAGDTTGFQDVFISGNTLSSSPLSGPSSLTPLTGLSIATRADALTTLTALDGYFAEVHAVRGAIGVGMSRFAAAAANLRTTTEDLAAAESRIVDADVGEESADLVKTNILQQAGAAILTQANQQPALALRLLADV